jgi:cell division protein FtsW
VFAIGLLFTPWRTLRKAAWWIYGADFVLLLTVYTQHAVNGSHRWIKIGFINVQPSEYAKIAIILVLAHYLSANEGRIRDFWGVLVPAVLVPVPILAAVFLEPDFGSFLVLSVLVGLLLFLAGLQWRWIVGGGAAALAAITFLLLLEPYRVKRLQSFGDPFADSGGAGYQVVQGWIALASGGWFGHGLGTGVAQRGFLPEAHTDFISAVVGEELGAVGWIAMMVAYMVVVWRGTHIASRAPDLFGQLVAMGVTTLLGMQAIINLGVVCGWLPAKGLVLPFLSYGASAVTVHIICVGLLLRIGLEGRSDAAGRA